MVGDVAHPEEGQARLAQLEVLRRFGDRKLDRQAGRDIGIKADFDRAIEHAIGAGGGGLGGAAIASDAAERLVNRHGGEGHAGHAQHDGADDGGGGARATLLLRRHAHTPTPPSRIFASVMMKTSTMNAAIESASVMLRRLRAASSSGVSLIGSVTADARPSARRTARRDKGSRSRTIAAPAYLRPGRDLRPTSSARRAQRGR